MCKPINAGAPHGALNPEVRLAAQETRLVRIETRLVRLMEYLGIDPNGRPTHDPAQMLLGGFEPAAQKGAQV